MQELEAKIYVRWILLKESIKDFFLDEDGDVNIVSIVVLIGIAVVLAVLFRGRIESLLGNLLDAIDRGATEATGSGG